MLYNPRALVNKSGVVYDSTKLSTLFMEDMDEIVTAFASLDSILGACFSATLSGDFTATSGSGTVVVPFDSILFDPGSNFDTITHEFTVPVDGVYNFSVNLTNKQFGGIERLIGYIYVNGAVKRNFSVISDSTMPTYFSGNANLSLTAGDVVDIRFGASPTFTIKILQSEQQSQFSCSLVGLV